MLPKVANHLLHHTSRAVAAVHNQTGHTIRNVLQLQSSSSPSSGNLGGWNGASSSHSGWSGNGTNSGGAKNHSGSRFHSTYTGAGRAVTQAEPSSFNDSTDGYADDWEEARSPLVTHRSPRRRKSVSFGTKDRGGESLGVLKTVQSHRSRQPFSEHVVGDRLTSSLVSQRNDHAYHRPSHSTSYARYNSTAVSRATGPEYLDLSPPLSPAPSLITYHATGRHTGLPLTPPEDPLDDSASDQEAFAALKAARSSGNASSVLHEVQKLRAGGGLASASLYNAALQALADVRNPGESLQTILQTYSEMIARSILPNFRTYTILIHALTTRDHELHRAFWNSNDYMAKLPTPVELRALGSETHSSFDSAITLFQTACSIPKSKLPPQIYGNLLRSCAIHANVDAAIYVFAHLEKRSDVTPNAYHFRHLIDVYASVGDLNGAREVFAAFREACESERISWPTEDVAEEDAVPYTSLGAHAARLAVWNQMVETYIRCGQPTGAIGLLEQMLDSDAGEAFVSAGVPLPASSTFASIVVGFCRSGDVATALSWFDRLLKQDASPRHPYEATRIPTRPNQKAWTAILHTLAVEGMVEPLNRLFSHYLRVAVQDGLNVRGADRTAVLRANLRLLHSNSDLDPVVVTGLLDFVVDTVIHDDLAQMRFPSTAKDSSRTVFQDLTQSYLAHGCRERVMDIAERYVGFERSAIHDAEVCQTLDADEVLFKTKGLRNVVQALSLPFLEADMPVLTLDLALRFANLSHSVGIGPTATIAPYYLRAYSLSKSRKDSNVLTVGEWEMLVHAVIAAGALRPTSSQDTSSPRDDGSRITLESLLEDMAQSGVDVSGLAKYVRRRIVDTLLSRYDATVTEALLHPLGPPLVSLLQEILHETNSTATPSTDFASSQDIITPPPSSPTSYIHVDLYHSKFVDEYYPAHQQVSPIMAYNRFEAGMRNGVYPRPEVIARLIGALGRLGEKDKVRVLYDAAQMVLATLEHQKQRQSVGWFQVEDHMIIGLAHAGDIDGAHVHRLRIIDQGGSPSADAYGALIHLVKDTTDDTSNAMALFEESQMRGVMPNIYLYNTIISKLAKARKADHALELFQQMKSRLIWPTSVTYGAVIAACCRVGDAHSAEHLFEEMLNQRNFKPRVPPYNTMMQLYTHTKPDRDRVLHYYDALRAANVKPTAHTYKLLLDAYGCIQPVDLPAMEKVFDHLTAGSKPIVQSTHWAALINAWGCVQKDLDKALSIFNSVATHPSTRLSGAAFPDAVIFEALINVLVTLRRPDLIPLYAQRLSSYHIHMTAYIANLLIRGYASAGDIERARDVFEGLVDPPEGMAALHNHAPHDNEPRGLTHVPEGAPVYREPSTWEAMVRAELGNGNRDRAVALLERAQARKFPPAVYNRISGIMLDDSVSPWPLSDAASSPDA
ncbi:hypothetical protein B0H21DRAFT_124526 [Amylocystis lapponica]|nr:hypothetical protein B0H21DRAFT_124526 [Amylocystis lapponica]